MFLSPATRFLRRGAAVALGALALAAAPSIASNDNADAESQRALAEQRRGGVARPIVDTHIHFYQPSRAGAVPWPPAGSTLYRDVLPAEYKALLAEEYLAPFGTKVRDKVMFRNALKFYRRVPPQAHH